MVDVGFEVAAAGGTSGAVLNAANEVAVERFLNGEILFTDITRISRDILDQHTFDAKPDLTQIICQDAWARKEALRWTPS